MGTAVKVPHKDHPAAELPLLAAKSRNAARARQMLAIAMVLDGASRADAATKGLVSRPALSRRRNCRRRTWRNAVTWLSPAPIWRCLDLRAEVTRRFCVTVPERTIGIWLGDLDSNQGCPGQSREFYR